jgi:hypothetical protein
MVGSFPVSMILYRMACTDSQEQSLPQTNKIISANTIFAVDSTRDSGVKSGAR